MQLEVDVAARQFLRALRGKRSQQAWARKLGYKGNPVPAWETGRRCPTAREVLRAAAIAKVDVERAFRQFHRVSPPAQTVHGYAVGPWLNELRGSTSLVELAARIGRSRFAVARWLSGKAEPRIHEFFALVDATTGRLPEWVANFVDIEKVPILAAQLVRVEAARWLAYNEPWSEAILRLLELRDYHALSEHVEGWLAARLGITPDHEKELLMRLVEAGILEYRDGAYITTGGLVVDTRGVGSALAKLRAHWSGVAMKRALAQRQDDLFAYNVISVSRVDAERIRERLRATFREIRAIVMDSEPTEVAALVQVQMFAFDDATEDGLATRAAAPAACGEGPHADPSAQQVQTGNDSKRTPLKRR